MFRTAPLHRQEFFTVHTAMVYVIQVCWQLARRIKTFRPNPVRKLSANLYDIYHCSVYSEKIPDDGHRNCPKHAEFYSKNKFDKLVHLFGFIVRMYHDGRSPERAGLGLGRSVLILLADCQQTCMTYHRCVHSDRNSWWWTQELSETCRVLFQK